MAVLWTSGVRSGRLTPNEFVAVASENIARILNIYPRKGAVAVGSDADLVVWDPSATKTISVKTQKSAIDYNVFEGLKVEGLPAATVSRGEVVWMDGELQVERGAGNWVDRPPETAAHRAIRLRRQQTAPKAVVR